LEIMPTTWSLYMEAFLLLGVRLYLYIEAVAACLGIGLSSVLPVPVHHSLF